MTYHRFLKESSFTKKHLIRMIKQNIDNLKLKMRPALSVKKLLLMCFLATTIYNLTAQNQVIQGDLHVGADSGALVGEGKRLYLGGTNLKLRDITKRKIELTCGLISEMITENLAIA